MSKPVHRVVSLLGFFGLLAAGLVSQELQDETWFVLKNVRLDGARDVESAPVDLVVRDGMIVEVSPHEAARVWSPLIVQVDLSGSYVAPGIYDAGASLVAPEPAPGAGENAVSRRPARGRRDRDDVNASEGSENLHSIGDAAPERSFAERGIQPELTALDLMPAFGQGDLAALKSGQLVRLCLPPNGIVAGQAAVIHLGVGGQKQVILKGRAGLVCGFRSARQGYPSTVMGVMAEHRHLHLDRLRHAEWRRLHRETPRGVPRPPFVPTLDYLVDSFANEPWIYWCRNAAEVRLTLRLAAEFGLRPVIGGDHGLADAAVDLAAAGVEVLLAAQIPDLTYEVNRDLLEIAGANSRPSSRRSERRQASGPDTKLEPVSESRPDSRPESQPVKDMASRVLERYMSDERRRREAIERRETLKVLTAPARLYKAGVQFRVCTGTRPGTDLLRFVRLAMTHGLPETAAREALGDRENPGLVPPGVTLGVFESGATAFFLITTGPLLNPDTIIKGAVVDGRRFEFSATPPPPAPASAELSKTPRRDILGTWSVEIRGFGKPGTAELTPTDQGFAGTFHNEETTSKISDGTIEGTLVRFTLLFVMGGASFEVRARAVLDGDVMRGTVEAPEMGTLEFTARRAGTGEPR